MKIYFLALIALCCSCHSQVASKNATYNDKENIVKAIVPISSEKYNDDKDVISTSAIKCGDNVFALVVEYQGNGLKVVNLRSGDTAIKTINLPSQSEVNGFSLNWAKQTNEGFEISIEYGSRLYYQKDFGFTCNRNDFYLSKVRINTFDKQNPENSWKEYIKLIKPELPLKKFLVSDYLDD
jgi:hypothetical protein